MARQTKPPHVRTTGRFSRSRWMQPKRTLDCDTPVRFWEHVNGGFVKLTLYPGQTLRHSQGGSHDEGWWSRANTWTFDGKEVVNDSLDDGTDCDGRLSRRYVGACPVEKLYARIQEPPYAPVVDGKVVGLPDWQEVRSGQRDYTAEAAGY